MAQTTPNEVVKRATGVLMQEYVYDVNYTDFAAASTVETVDLVTLPADWVHIAAYGEVITPFSDAGSITAMSIEIGTSGDPDALIDGHAPFGATAGDRYQGGAAENASWAGVAVKAKATATGANLGDGTDTGLDAGKIRYHFFGYRIASDV